MEANLFTRPSDIRQWLERAKFRYPSTRNELTEAYSGFAQVPVFPTLWKWLHEHGLGYSPDEWLEPLMQLADIGTSAEARIRNRAKKFLFDFGREVHAGGLLAERFGTVRWRGASDLNQAVDFIIDINNKQAGIMTYMAASWKTVDWLAVKERRLRNRGGKPPPFPVVTMTNQLYEPERLWNGVWLFNRWHVNEVVKQLLALGYSLPSDFLEKI